MHWLLLVEMMEFVFLKRMQPLILSNLCFVYLLMCPKPIAKMLTVWPGIPKKQVCWPHAVTMEKLPSGSTNQMLNIERECSL